MRQEQVKRVIDGDTLTTASRKHSVRLANVNAPERGERGAVAATKALAELVRDKKVSVETVARDKYGRSVANVKVGGRSVNAAMRRKGYK
jgi:endonuclease YncB( thermonuclease family)